MKHIGMCGTCVILMSVFAVHSVAAQSTRSLVREGNRQYESEKYGDAEVSYRKALEKEQELLPGHFNLGNALYKQGKATEAIREYESALAKSEDKRTRADAYYNMGNAFMKDQHYQEAVNSYIESLKLTPGDQDAKYNLSYALAKLKEQQQQQQKKDGKDNKQDQKQQQDQQKQDQQKQQQQQQDQQRADQQKQQQKQSGAQEKKMAKADAERILDVLKNNERDLQRKLRARPAVRAKVEKDW
jgi:tetratricopeptide (TPR) repeat protein